MNNDFMTRFIGQKFDIETEGNFYYDAVVKEVFDGWILVECDDEIVYLNLLMVENIKPVIEEIEIQDKPKRGLFRKNRE